MNKRNQAVSDYGYKNKPKQKSPENFHQVWDELKVQTHLLQAEVKDEWKIQLSPARKAALRSVAEIKNAGRSFLKTVRENYERVRKSLPV